MVKCIHIIFLGSWLGIIIFFIWLLIQCVWPHESNSLLGERFDVFSW